MKKLISLLLVFSFLLISPMVAFAQAEQSVPSAGMGDNGLNLKSSVEYTEDGFIERGSFSLDGENFTYIQVTTKEGTEVNIVGDKGTLETLVIPIDPVVDFSAEMPEFNLSGEGILSMPPQTFNYTGNTLVPDIAEAGLFYGANKIMGTAMKRHFPYPSNVPGLFSLALNLSYAWYTWHNDLWRAYYEKEVIREFWPDDDSSSPYRDLVKVVYWRNSDFSGHIRTSSTIIHPILDK